MVEQPKHPAMAARLENGEPGVVLPQHQNAVEREAEGPAEDDAVRPAVRDHQHPLPGVAGDDRLEGGPRACLHGPQTISAVRRVRTRSLEYAAARGARASRRASAVDSASPRGDSGTSRCPMNRRLSDPTTLPWRAR